MGFSICESFDRKLFHCRWSWLHLGWQGRKKVDSIHVPVRIKNEKIWVEEDRTEERIATELTKKGIAANDIVLAFAPSDDRKYTDLATA
jgi:hypothetical protein